MRAPKHHSAGPGTAIDEKSARAAYDRLPTINGYPETFSLFCGEILNIRAARKSLTNPGADSKASDTPALVKHIKICDAVTNKTVSTFEPPPTRIFDERPASYRDAGAAYTCRIEFDTGHLPAGLYECVIIDDTGTKSKEIYFNLKPHSFDGCDILCVLPTFTWQAYNRIGGGSFYTKHLGALRTLSSQRPMSRKRDNFIASALPFLAAFESERIRAVCVDSSDLDRGLCPQGRIPVMALLTHDEYWSAGMRAKVDRFLQHRGSLLVMAGNVCWWQIEVDGDNISVRKGVQQKRSHWYTGEAPEETTFVSSFRFGGYPVELAREKDELANHVAALSKEDCEKSRALQVVAPDHPIFRGVKLGPDNIFGGEVPIIYREIDGVPLNSDGTVDRTLYKADGVAPHILATGFAVGNFGQAGLRKAGVIVEADVGAGHVLHMGTFGWSLGLAQNNQAVKQIVLNAYRYCRARAG
jgi:hypothetical protein